MADPPRKRTVSVAQNRVVAPSVRLLTFSLEPTDQLHFDPGQFVTFYVPRSGTTVTRSYSICSSPDRESDFDLCIKQVDGGFVSTYLSARSPGERQNVIAPLGRFLLRDPESHPVIFASTGTGIAPFIPMLERLERMRPGHPRWLFSGCRHKEDLLFHPELSAMGARDPSFHYVPVLSRPPPTWSGASGHLQDTLRSMVPALAGCHLYICGVPQMVAEVQALAQELGCPREQTFIERY